ncbi:MAG: hypothetical protein DRO46_03860 [Candidatus Hecatellales archaeon]|nr:MAG: hypothetical protein DRO46_03860 [Candidatus Hecatellales archaeon]
MKPGLSNLFLTGRPKREMLRFIENCSGECKVWELVDDGSLKLDEKTIGRLKELASSYGLEYSVHAPFTDLNIASLNPHIRRISLKMVEASMQHAYKLEAKTMVVHPGFKGAQESFRPGEAWRDNIKIFQNLLAKAEKLQLKLAVENMPQGSWSLLSTVEDFKKFFSSDGLEGLGMTLDVGHALTVGQLNSFIEEFKDRIWHVHIHDNTGDSDKHLGFGEGTLNWPLTVRRLKRNGFSGFLIVESTRRPFETFLKVKALIEELEV